MHASSSEDNNETHQNHASATRLCESTSLSLSFPIMPLIGLCWRAVMCGEEWLHFLATLFALRARPKGLCWWHSTLISTNTNAWSNYFSDWHWKLLWTCCQKQLASSLYINIQNPMGDYPCFILVKEEITLYVRTI